jgi:hypothetical protein
MTSDEIMSMTSDETILFYCGQQLFRYCDGMWVAPDLPVDPPYKPIAQQALMDLTDAVGQFVTAGTWKRLLQECTPLQPDVPIATITYRMEVAGNYRTARLLHWYAAAGYTHITRGTETGP